MPSDARLSLTARTFDGESLERLRFTNAPGQPFRYAPDRFNLTFSLDGSGKPSVPGDWLMLDLPAGWLSLPARSRSLPDDTSVVTWSVYPRLTPAYYRESVRVRVMVGAREVARAEQDLAIEVAGYSQFVPARHALPWANSAAELGPIEPDLALFARTYPRTLLPPAFFRGLYRAIVSLDDQTDGYRGGLCTGFARAALERSLRPMPEGRALLREAMIFHGRQLTDRALLAGALWFLVPSPRRAFHRFRSDILSRECSDLCFDVGVPVPWRRDVLTALTREGHTVVPYAFRQATPDRAEVFVYDPNHPPVPGAAESVLVFDLARNTYGYRDLARLDERRTSVVAVRQGAYRDGRTAFLASAVSLALYPRSLRGSLPKFAAGVTAAVTGQLAALSATAIRRRRPRLDSA